MKWRVDLLHQSGHFVNIILNKEESVEILRKCMWETFTLLNVDKVVKFENMIFDLNKFHAMTIVEVGEVVETPSK